MRGIRLCDPNTDEWLEARRQGIGASEVASALGLSQYQSPRKLWHIKRGEYETEVTQPMRLGHHFERGIFEEWSLQTGLTAVEPTPAGLWRHADLEWMLATPDFLTSDNNLCETKATTWRNKELGQQGSDELPITWLCQAHTQMEVMDAEVCHFAVLVDMRIRTYLVWRDRDVIARMLEPLEEFWRRVQEGRPPRETKPDLAMVKKVFNTIEVEKRELSDLGAYWMRRYKRLQKASEKAQKLADEAKAALLIEVGDAGLAVHRDGNVKRVWVNQKESVRKACSYIRTTVTLNKEPDDDVEC
ncbi:MAG: hypothetical protein HC841_00370 [Verrucomicrobiae bacterium]|nr:hypothetical protein [Verrucomicrobiae bacterium]